MLMLHMLVALMLHMLAALMHMLAAVAKRSNQRIYTSQD
jgi:hypothetical protein